MCGLAGVVDLTGRELPPRAAANVLDALAHRGPDARHVWFEAPCTLLHSRLRIIDLAARSDQPMIGGRDDRIVMVYNGEVYNFRALRDELERAGWRFATASDAEVLLTGYAAWGVDVFRRARGMWAVAFWHPRSRRLTLARDPLGKKPLFCAADGHRLAFASNMRALLPLLDRQAGLDLDAIDCYLGHLVVPFEHSVFSGVKKLAPGTVMHYTPEGGVREERYWTVPTAPGTVVATDVPAEVERLLRQAVRRRLESDVPLGVFLSAGFDSGLVAAIAAEESGRPLVAVTAGTTGSGYDERRAAGEVARRYGLEHRPLEVPALSAAALPQLIAELGEPFGDASLLPSYEVARVARREITVALTGDGGDEGFFGYGTFRGVYLAEYYRKMVPGPLRRALWRATIGYTDGWRRRAGAFFEYGVKPLSVGFRYRMGFDADQRRDLLGERPGHHAEHVYAERLSRYARLPDADALRRMFFETFLPNDYLTKLDTATMAASLEARCPFLDVDLVEYALSLPAAVAFPGGRLKALLRPLVRRLLPEGTLDRSKTGFVVPVAQWLRGPLTAALEEFVLRRTGPFASIINPAAARRLLEEHRSGADHGTRLWALLALGVWFAQTVERRWPVSDPLPLTAAA